LKLTEPVLELRDATVVKGDRRVLDGLTLTIHAGQHTAIVGPNGAGKSVLVNLLTHDDRPLRHDDGSPPVRVFGDGNWNASSCASARDRLRPYHRFVSQQRRRVTAEAAVPVWLPRDLRTAPSPRTPARGRGADANGRTSPGGSTRCPPAAWAAAGRAPGTSPRALVLMSDDGLDPWPVTTTERAPRLRAGTTIILITHHIEEIVPEIDTC
jgi:iron complex transport system ATP-binding protein